nr:hypothetical protein [Tanacetum cinerariifolium]
MLIKSLEWRKAYGADFIIEQDLGFKALENRVCYNMGCDRQGGVNSIILVQDFKHRASRPLIDVDEKIFSILRDNYPGMISYMILLNVPWICRAVISLRSLFNGNESMKLVMSYEASVPETLYKYISPEHIPQL